MPASYSINVGTLIEASRKPDIFTVLQNLPDNTQKLISPRDVRDAFLSTWANSAFKITTPGSISTEYIGLDSGNPSDRDIKQRIFLGKRSYGNLDIMNSTLLNSNNADIFLYNTKSDSVNQSSTKVSILAGTDSNMHIYAPYFESTATNSVINFNIHNPSLYGGDINIASSAGRVAINGVVFPTIAETTANASNGRILKYAGTYPNGYLTWADATLTLTSIGSPTQSTNLWGDPVNVNGFPLEFSDDELVPYAVGGLTAGMSFSSGGFYNPITATTSDWPVSEIIRRILYPYYPPKIEFSVTTIDGGKYIEAGTNSSLSFSYSITSYARNSDEWIRDLFIKELTQTYPSYVHYGSLFSDDPGQVRSIQFQYSTLSSVGTLTYSLFAATSSFATSSSPGIFYNFEEKDSIQSINPVFFGFSNQVPAVGGTAIANIGQIISTLNKSILPYPGESGSLLLTATGSGYLYFLYPSTFLGTPSLVYDPNGFLIHDTSVFSPDFFHGSLYMSPSRGLFNGNVNTIVKDYNNKIYVGGSFTSYGLDFSQRIFRLNSNGTVDTSFQNATFFPFNSYLFSIVVQSDNKPVLFGYFTSFNTNSNFYVVRLNTDGSYDSTYNVGSSFNTVPGQIGNTNGFNRMVIQNDDKVIFVGDFTSFNGTTSNRIVRLQTDGSVDPTFITAGGFNGRATTVSLQNDGKIIVGGGTGSAYFTQYGASMSSGNIVRLLSNGNLDNTFNADIGPGPSFIKGVQLTSAGSAYILSIKVQSDGKILIGGNFSGYGLHSSGSVVRVNSNGSVDTSFISGIPSSIGPQFFVTDMTIQSDGKIVVVGSFDFTSSGKVFRNIVRLNSNGSLDLNFNNIPGLFSAVYPAGNSSDVRINTILQESDGKLLIGGLFTNYGTSSVSNLYKRDRIARLTTDGVLYRPPIYSTFDATASTWYYGGNVLATPYSGSYKVWVSSLPITYLNNAKFKFVF